MDRSKAREAVHLAGSIASITGVSLLWLKDIAPQTKLWIAVPMYLLASLFSMGVISLAWIFFDFGHKFFLGGFAIPRIEPSLAGKLAYTGLVGGLLLFLTGTVVIELYMLAYSLVRDLIVVG